MGSVGSVGSVGSLAQELVIFGMCSDPKPKQPFWDLNRKRSIVKANSDRPVFAKFLEMQ